MLNGPVRKTLIDLTLPMILGVLAMIAFNLVDTYFIGRLGTRQLAAISFTFPVILLVASVAQGIGIGLVSLVSNSIGRNDHLRAARETTDGLALALLLVAVFSTVGYLTIDPVFTLLGVTADIMPYVRDYMEVWYVAILFVIIPMVGNNAIRATGDTKTPSYIMLGAVAINAVLDPILIFGWGPIEAMGLRGAAMATAISRGLTMLAAMYILYFRERLITSNIGSFAALLGCVRAILEIGIPAMIARIANPVGLGILTSIISGIGASSVAAYGVGTRIEMFALSVVTALASVVGPFIGQNLGAKNIGRIRESFRISFRFTLLWGLAGAAVLAALARPVAAIFTDDPVVLEDLIWFIYLVPVGYAGLGIFLITSISLNALQRPKTAAALSLLQALGLAVPMAWIAQWWLGDVRAVFLAIALSYLITGLVSYRIAWRTVDGLEVVNGADHRHA